MIWGYPYNWMVYFMENPSMMMTGDTPSLRKPLYRVIQVVSFSAWISDVSMGQSGNRDVTLW